MTMISALNAMRRSAVLTVLLLVLFSAIEVTTFAREKPSRTDSTKKAAAASTQTTPDLNSDIRRQLDAVPVKGLWKHIVIHHTGTVTGTAKGIDRFHREERHMENGLAYHFLIGNGRGMGDGEIFVGERWKKQLPGGHLASETLNQSSIGICLVGNFDRTRPTKEQMESLKALTKKLLELTALPPSAVTTHREIHPGHTRCPGKLFKL
jgi:N-acetyl-anhydromuramyl-L-alanine amidase AmpD